MIFGMKKPWCQIKVGKFDVKIDKEDLKRISNHTWRIYKRSDSQKPTIITSIRSSIGVRNISLGKFLKRPPAGKMVYPRRHFEGFDFRKNNLIVCTVQERQRMLPKKNKDKSSSYRGVSLSRSSKLWRASITVDGRSMNLGDFHSESSAALMYNAASRKYFGVNGYQNIISRSKNRRK